MKCLYFFTIVTLLFASLNAKSTERVKDLVKEVKILNLLNGFEISEEQKSTIGKRIREIEKIQDRFEKTIENDAEIFEAGLEKTIEILEEGKKLPPSLKKDISTYNKEVKELHREKEEEIINIVKKVEEILQPQQIQLLKDFIPCLIPPPGEARVGQSGSPHGIVKHLEKIRELPENIYSRERENIIEIALKKKKENSPLQEEFDEDEEREMICSILERTRTMGDVDFALKKNELAEEFKGEKKKRDSEKDILHKIRNFLLDPIVLKYL